MALLKAIELENGIITNYHRIVSLNKITNVSNIIEVASYISEAKRIEEKNALGEGQKIGVAVPMNVYINTNYINKEYNELETIEDAYEYLRNTEKYENAQNV